jgi:hypothetical protein
MDFMYLQVVAEDDGDPDDVMTTESEK